MKGDESDGKKGVHVREKAGRGGGETIRVAQTEVDSRLRWRLNVKDQKAGRALSLW